MSSISATHQFIKNQNGKESMTHKGASRSAQSKECSSLSLLSQFLDLFFCPRGREGQRWAQPCTKSLFSILRKANPYQLSIFWEALLQAAIFVYCQLEIQVNWAIWLCLRSRKRKQTPERSNGKMLMDRCVWSDFDESSRAGDCAFDFK